MLVVGRVAGYNYCTITPFHTLCGYKGPKSVCGSTYARGLTQAEKYGVLEYHNKLRSKVAMGYTTQPPASNMMELRWDNELAWVAQGLADTCKFGHDCNDCRSVSRFRVGQNLYQSYKTRTGPRDWKAAMDAWFHSEIGLFPTSSVYRYVFNHVTGHYSQMVWAKTTRVGCGLTEYRLGKWIAKLYVCNYGEGGNVISAPVYSVGNACYSCPRYTSCSTRYAGLCSFQATPRVDNQALGSDTVLDSVLPPQGFSSAVTEEDIKLSSQDFHMTNIST